MATTCGSRAARSPRWRPNSARPRTSSTSTRCATGPVPSVTGLLSRHPAQPGLLRDEVVPVVVDDQRSWPARASGFDVVGAGELRIALAGGADPRRIVMHGNAKSDARHPGRARRGHRLHRRGRLRRHRPDRRGWRRARTPVLLRVSPGIESHDPRRAGHRRQVSQVRRAGRAGARGTSPDAGRADDRDARPARTHRLADPRTWSSSRPRWRRSPRWAGSRSMTSAAASASGTSPATWRRTSTTTWTGWSPPRTAISVPASSC